MHSLTTIKLTTITMLDWENTTQMAAHSMCSNSKGERLHSPSTSSSTPVSSSNGISPCYGIERKPAVSVYSSSLSERCSHPLFGGHTSISSKAVASVLTRGSVGLWPLIGWPLTPSHCASQLPPCLHVSIWTVKGCQLSTPASNARTEARWLGKCLGGVWTPRLGAVRVTMV